MALPSCILDLVDGVQKLLWYGYPSVWWDRVVLLHPLLTGLYAEVNEKNLDLSSIYRLASENGR